MTIAKVRPVRPKYQVFISSTFQDLRQTREAVTWEILKAGHIPVGMENFSALDDRGWKVIDRTLGTTDYYVLLVAGRYGSIDSSLGISWTEREYVRAIELGIPILAFVRDKRHITADHVDTGENALKLAKFIESVSERRLREAWTTDDDLRARVTAALTKAIMEDEADGIPRLGWYRGDQLPTALSVDELARLSSENHTLREELESLRAASSTAPKVRFELLDENSSPVSDLQIKVPRYVEPSHGATLTMRVLSNDSDGLDDFLEKTNQTVWLNLRIKNSGTEPARNVTVDFDIEGAHDVTLVEDEPRSKMSILSISAVTPQWILDPNEHVYVDSRRRNGDRYFLRQRIKGIGVSGSEQLMKMGVRGTIGDDNGVRLVVHYMIQDEKGDRLEGAFNITKQLDGLRKYKKK